MAAKKKGIQTEITAAERAVAAMYHPKMANEPAEVYENRRRDAELAAIANQSVSDAELAAIANQSVSNECTLAPHPGRSQYSHQADSRQGPPPLSTDFADPIVVKLLTLAFQALTDELAVFALGDAVLESNWYNDHMRHYGYTQEGNLKCASHPTILQHVPAKPNRQWAKAVLASLIAEVGPYLPAHPHDKPIHRYALGFPELCIQPNSAAEANVVPELTFRGNRLVIPADVGRSVNVERLMTANQNCIIGSQGLPGELFAPTSLAIELHMPTATPANRISLRLYNRSQSAVTVRAVLLGMSMPYNYDGSPRPYGL